MSEEEKEETAIDQTDSAPEEKDTENQAPVEAADGDDVADGDASVDEVSEYVLALAEPISGADPCGEDVKYDEDFESIKDEIDKLSENDFGLIIELSEELLREKTKDILVASYLAYALTHRDGINGFAEGIGVVSTLSDRFWEDLHPKRVPARRNALTFYAQKVAGALQGYKPIESDRAPLGSAISRLDAFQSSVMELMGDQAPALSGVKRVLTDLERKLPKPKVASAPSSTAAGQEATSAAPGPPAEIQSVSDATTAVAKACAFLRSDKATSPVPYRVLRAMRWSVVAVTPPNENGKTKIPAPIEQRRTFLNGLLEKGEAEKLVQEGEASFQEGGFHFWIDLQRLIAAGMKQLGSDYEQALTAVLEETAILLRRIPDLKQLTFSDGTPFVSPLCADWLAADVEPLLSSGDDATAAAEPDLEGGSNLEATKTEALALLGKGDLQAAIAAMRKGGENDRSAKERFLRQLYLAELCVKGKRPAIARTILEGLDSVIEEHGLAEWEPDIALAAWAALHGCYQTLIAKAAPAEKPALAKTNSEIFDKICRVDASYALTLPGS